MEKHNVSVYNERTKKGDVRTIVTRVGFETGEVQVVLVTAKETLPNKDEIVKAIQNLAAGSEIDYSKRQWRAHIRHFR